MEENGEGVRLMGFLYARSRFRAAVERGLPEEYASLEFDEHFIGKNEGDTAGYAKEAVAANLGAMRLSEARERGWR